MDWNNLNRYIIVLFCVSINLCRCNSLHGMILIYSVVCNNMNLQIWPFRSTSHDLPNMLIINNAKRKSTVMKLEIL